jgi:hypothetical protein
MAEERIAIEVEGRDVESVAPQIPRAETLPPGTRVVAFAGKARAWLGKILPPRGAPPSAAMASALLARGYVNISAGEDGGRAAVWGDSSLPPGRVTEPSEGP